MPVPNAEPVVELNPDHEAGLFRATRMAVEVATLLKVHRSTVYEMAKRRELPGFKIRRTWRFDRAQIAEWMRSRMQGA
jgi:excisionase family DNA binding protein